MGHFVDISLGMILIAINIRYRQVCTDSFS